MSEQTSPDAASAVPTCPKCQGPMWDNREGKRNPKAPDFKCKDRGCDGVIWPPRGATASAVSPTTAPVVAPAAARETSPVAAGPRLPADGMPACPICGGPMWDDRLTKRNPRAPDFKCKNKPRERGGPGCEGVIWPPRDGSPSPYPPPAQRRATPSAGRQNASLDAPPPYHGPPPDDDDLPF